MARKRNHHDENQPNAQQNLQADLDAIRKNFADALSSTPNQTNNESINLKRESKQKNRSNYSERMVKACNLLEKKAKSLNEEEMFDYFTKYQNQLAVFRRECRNAGVHPSIRERFDTIINGYKINQNKVIEKRLHEHRHDMQASTELDSALLDLEQTLSEIKASLNKPEPITISLQNTTQSTPQLYNEADIIKKQKETMMELKTPTKRKDSPINQKVNSKALAERNAAELVNQLNNHTVLEQAKKSPGGLRKLFADAEKAIQKCKSLGSNINQMEKQLTEAKNAYHSDIKHEANQAKRDHYKQHGKNSDKRIMTRPGMNRSGG